MDSPDSRAETTANAPDASPSVYGVAEFGAEWEDARAVVVVIHGRDRDPAELARRIADVPQLRDIRILAPYITSQCWYPDRYDAPLEANAAALSSGLAHIEAVMQGALDQGAAREGLVLAGFSQGACMVLEYVLSQGTRPAAALAFTGSLLDLRGRAPHTGDLEGLPMIVTSGATDEWLPTKDLLASAAVLERAGADVHIEIFPDGLHIVRDQEISLLDDLLQQIGK